MKKFMIILVTIMAVVVLTLGFIGFIPGLSKFLVKPKDLGVQPDPAIVSEVNSRVGYMVDLNNPDVPSVSEPVYSGQKVIDDQFSSVEITSVLDSWSREWRITPFYSVQVSLDGNGGAASGVLKLSKALEMASRLGYTNQEIERAKSYATFVNGDVPFFAQGSVSVVENQVNLDLNSIQVGRVTLPDSISVPLERLVEDVVEKRIGVTTGLEVDSMTIEDGKMKLLGMIPEKVSEN